MARVSVTLTFACAVLFFFVTLSHGRVPGNDVVVVSELSNSLPESDVSPIIRLPSDTVKAEPEGEAKESEHLTVASVPLSLVSFRPVNRHFLHRSRFPSRPCHHHRHNHGQFKPMMGQKVEIPYGDDMILSGGENGDFDDPMMFHRGVQRIPARWVRLHHHHHRHHDDHEHDHVGGSKFVFKHSDRFGKEKFRKHLHHENEEERHNEKVKKNEGGGFMKRIRKILDHF